MSTGRGPTLNPKSKLCISLFFTQPIKYVFIFENNDHFVPGLFLAESFLCLTQ